MNINFTFADCPGRLRKTVTWVLAILSGSALSLCSAWLLRGDPDPFFDAPVAPNATRQQRSDPMDRHIEALRADPASAWRWVQLGHALVDSGQSERAGYCYKRAVDLAPYSPPVLIEAASFAHAAGSLDDGLRLMARVLAVARDYDELIFSFYRRLSEAQSVLRWGLPDEPAAARAWFVHLLEAGDLNSAAATWGWLVHSRLIEDTLLRRYVAALLEAKCYTQALEIFATSLPTSERAPPGDHVTHGGFEASTTAAALDWTTTPSLHANVRRDDAVARSGRWSLRVGFDARENLEYRHVSQKVVVSAGVWRLRAFVRAEGVTTDEGIGLRVFDVESPSRLSVRTAHVLGVSDWRPVEATFQIPDGRSRLLQVEIVRRASRKMDNKISGTAWIDDVSLTRMDGLETRAGGQSFLRNRALEEEPT